MSPRTFFSYFASKEDVLFLNAEDRVEQLAEAAAVGGLLGAAALAGVAAQERGDTPEQVLAAARRAIEIAVAGLSSIGQPGPAERRRAG